MAKNDLQEINLAKAVLNSGEYGSNEQDCEISRRHLTHWDAIKENKWPIILGGGLGAATLTLMVWGFMNSKPYQDLKAYQHGLFDGKPAAEAPIVPGDVIDDLIENVYQRRHEVVPDKEPTSPISASPTNESTQPLPKYDSVESTVA